MKQLNLVTDILDVAEARRRLPEVKKHLEQVMAAAQEIRRLHRGYVSGEDDSEASASLREQLEELEASYRTHVLAMNELGAYLKDPFTGLIDFYSWHGDEMVFLCYQYGESDILYYHGLRAGYAGRRPIGELPGN